MLNILIADDHPVVRMGINQIIASNGDMVVGYEASNGEEVLKEVSRNSYDLVILDIAMPGRSGLDILETLRNIRPKLPILILSIYPDEQIALRLIKAGASGYVAKDSAPEDLIDAIHKVMRGRKYISSSLAEIVVSSLDGEQKPPHEYLSNREYEIMHLIASGNKRKDIADKLKLSAKTISTYRMRIFKKMKLNNAAELTRYALQNHLID